MRDGLTAEDSAGLCYVPCAICQGDDAATWRLGWGAQIVRCRRDGLVYVNPRPSGARIQQQAQTFVRDDNLRLFELGRQRAVRREARVIQAIKSGGSLLDVGCATGALFRSFASSAWRLYGVEPCAEGAAHARRHGAEVFCGTLKKAQYPAASFDVITILDALYYFPDPVAELAECNRVLKPDGILAIEIPGLTHKLLRGRGPVRWLIDRKWRRMSTKSLHLYHFSPRTLRLLAARAGFEIAMALPEQSPLGRSTVADALNHLHFGLVKLLWHATGGRCSIASKEFYICRKADPSSATA